VRIIVRVRITHQIDGRSLLGSGVEKRRLAFLSSLLAFSLTCFPMQVSAQFGLGALGADGALRQEFSLGTVPAPEGLGFALTLRHDLSEDAPPQSLYEVPQLGTHLVADGGGGLTWRTLGQAEVSIPKEKIFREMPDPSPEDGVYAVWAGASQQLGFRIHTASGIVLEYGDGSLVRAENSAGQALEFETDGTDIISVRDGAGTEVLRVGYDDDGFLSSLKIGAVEHSFGHNVDSGQLEWWRPPGVTGEPVCFGYRDGLVKTLTFPDGERREYWWAPRDKVKVKSLGLRLPEGETRVYLVKDQDYRYSYGIDRRGVHIYRTDANGDREGYVRNPKTGTLIEVSADGGETTTIYTKVGGRRLLDNVRGPHGELLVKLTYDSEGRVVRRKELGMAVQRFRYDEKGRLVEVSRLSQLQRKYEYTGDSELPSAVTDAGGNRTEMDYESNGRLVAYRDPGGAEHAFAYDADGRLVKHTYPGGLEETRSYDVFGRLVEKKNIDGSVLRRRYEGAKLVSEERGGTEWDFRFGASGQLEGLLREGEEWQSVERKRLAEGEQVVVKKRGGVDKIIELDAKGNVRKERTSAGEETEYKRDAAGQLTGWTDPRGVVAGFERDALGRVTALEGAGGRELDLQYDNLGRLKRRKTGEQDIRYHYDTKGRLGQIDYGKGQTVDYTYDKFGRTRTATTAQGVKTTYTWDVLDRKTSERNDLPGGAWTLVKWSYTPTGRKKTVDVYKNGDDLEHRMQETGYAYDALGRYTAISVNGEEKIWYEYYPDTLRLKRKRYYNGWTIDYEHYPGGHPKCLVARDGDGKVVKDVSYVWSEGGKLETRVLDGVLHKYSYDSLGRLEEVKKTRLEETGQNPIAPQG